MTLISIKRLATTSTKAELKSEEDIRAKLQAFDLCCFRIKSHFEADWTQNYLVFQLVYENFKIVANTNKVTAWVSKGLPDESIRPPATLDSSHNPGTVLILKYNKYLMKDKFTTPKVVLNFFYLL